MLHDVDARGNGEQLLAVQLSYATQLSHGGGKKNKQQQKWNASIFLLACATLWTNVSRTAWWLARDKGVKTWKSDLSPGSRSLKHNGKTIKLSLVQTTKASHTPLFMVRIWKNIYIHTSGLATQQEEIKDCTFYGPVYHTSSNLLMTSFIYSISWKVNVNVLVKGSAFGYIYTLVIFSNCFELMLPCRSFTEKDEQKFPRLFHVVWSAK